MRIAISGILISIVLLSCNNTVNDNVIEPNEEISTVLDSFAKINECKKCLHELYIDKQDPHNYITIIYSGKQSLTREENSNNRQEALNIIKSSNGTEFKVYTGMEHYFRKSSVKHRKVLDTAQYQNDETLIWVVKDSFGKLTITKKNFAYPFMPLPRPEVDIRNFIRKDSIK